ncbi:MAG: hypothetical protein M3O01_03095 [Pseudomonadota bacterium]|nr:hypothetical protein [Pseudomonadota bacterium]
MKTIRLPEPFPRGKSAQKLEWGSSAWAADSCLVEWSRLEREWLGAPEPSAASSQGADGRLGRLTFVGAGLAMALCIGMTAWTFFT